MSTIHPSPAFGCIRPNRAHKLLQRLAALLALDEARRRPPPVSLPGRPADAESWTCTALTASSRARAEPHLECNGRVYRCESEPEDGKGPYSHDQLLQMNARFVQRLERAFANGDESRHC